MPFGYGGGGFRGDPRGGAQGGYGGEGADFGDIFEGLFGGRGGGGGGPFGGFGGRGAPPQKGANVAYRLAVTFIDAATQAMQRITLADGKTIDLRSEEHTSELQSLMRISYAVFCLKKKKKQKNTQHKHKHQIKA